MYLSHYRLTDKPFQISTDPKFLWLGEKHREALAVLKYGILNNQGFVLLTGDVGTGKTTLINALINSLDKDTLVAVISDPKLDKLEFFNRIAKAFRFKKSFQDKLDFTIYFGHFLKAAYRENKKVLLIIDEAQNISSELLEEIRLLSNIELPERKLLNTFFVGQNEFNNILVRNQCRPLRQRITVTYNIDPLTKSETSEYISHRLKVAGAAGDIFTQGAIGEVFSFSKGYPRLINIICDHALLTGYVKELHQITPRIIKECSRELILPGEIKSIKAQKLQTRKREPKKFGRRAILYSCLVLLFIPLFYPLVSTTLRNYLAGVVHFYEQLFEGLSLPAHSRNEVDSKTLLPEKSIQESPALSEQQSNVESQGTTEESSEGSQPLEGRSESALEFAEKPIGPWESKLVIPFDRNSNEVPESAYTDLNRIAAAALQDLKVTVVVKAYADEKGSEPYNRQLAEFQANIIKSYLVGRGVSPDRIEAVGMGKENALESNTTAAGRRTNRRVEVEIRS